jgi:hypothetical protein
LEEAFEQFGRNKKHCVIGLAQTLCYERQKILGFDSAAK